MQTPSIVAGVKKNGRIYADAPVGAKGVQVRKRAADNTVNANAYVSAQLPVRLNGIDVMGPGYACGIARMDVTVTDFTAISHDTKTRVQIAVTNANGSSYAAANLYNGYADIKIRGNYTAGLPKKPFNIVLVKQDGTSNNFPLFGMYNNTDFALLANYQDALRLRNYFFQQIHRAQGGVAVKTFPVALYFNNIFYGVFDCTEKVNKTLVGITALGTTAADQTLPNLSGGYLAQKVGLEQEDVSMLNYFDSLYYKQPWGYGWLPEFHHAISLEDPKFGKATQVQIDYHKQCVLNAEASFKNKWRDLVNGPQAFYDKNALLRYYFTNEFVEPIDGNILSSYQYIPRGGKIFLGAPWDGDSSIPVYVYFSTNENRTTSFFLEKTPYFDDLLKDPDFLEDLGIHYVNIARPALLQAIEEFKQRMQLLLDTGLFSKDEEKWATVGSNSLLSTGAPDGFSDKHFQDALSFIAARLAFFDITYCLFPASYQDLFVHDSNTNLVYSGPNIIPIGNINGPFRNSDVTLLYDGDAVEAWFTAGGSRTEAISCYGAFDHGSNVTMTVTLNDTVVFSGQAIDGDFYGGNELFDRTNILPIRPAYGLNHLKISIASADPDARWYCDGIGLRIRGTLQPANTQPGNVN